MRTTQSVGSGGPPSKRPMGFASLAREDVADRLAYEGIPPVPGPRKSTVLLAAQRFLALGGPLWSMAHDHDLRAGFGLGEALCQ